ncbi:MAG: T9SS type A sorting domain-containing protein [Saprospiraceae bacterium]
MKTPATLFFVLAISSSVFSNTWNIGPTRTYTLPSQIKTLVQNGDTIYLDAGTYVNDATKWNKNNLSFIGLGSGAVLQYSGDIPNGKGIWVFESPGSSDNTYIENIIFDGARVSDGDGANGAGIRYQANNITVKNCKFMNCQNGILEGHGSVNTSNVVILNSEFENNGYELPNDPNYSGYEHNIYISASADTLLVMNCYFHHPRGQGNSLKTRAQRSYILYNLIDEEDTGYGSWELNIAQGGLNIIMGNIIIQGPAGANHGIVSYDAATNALEDFYFVNNTVINKFGGNVRFFNISPSSGINTFKVYNNIFASVPGASNIMYSGSIPATLDTTKNIWGVDYMTLGFTDPSTDDYSLSENAILAINSGTNAGSTNTGYALTPVSMYQSYASDLQSRSIIGGTIDIGAYEYGTTTGINENQWQPDISIYPNPFHSTFEITLQMQNWKNVAWSIFDSNGHSILKNIDQDLRDTYNTTIDLHLYPSGIYFIDLKVDGSHIVKKIVKE